MNKKIVFLFVVFFFVFSDVFSQSGFRFFGTNADRQKVRFKLINNLIVIPLVINGKKLSFILDSGVSKTILFSHTINDSLSLKNVEKVTLKGLGKGKAISAILSKNNRFRLKNMISNNETIYVILKDEFDLSGKMGITVHGIIGYRLLKSVIARINYKTKIIDFYNPKTYTYKKCSKCEVFPLQFYRNKPYINLEVQLDTVNQQKTAVKMLIDSGGSDAVWLFEGTKEVIRTPKRFFYDVLGEGLSGTIYGKRSRIPAISLGRFKIKEPTVSFLDTTTTLNARKFIGRNGSIGGNILKRFKVWIDYTNKKITIKKNGSFKGGFNYNMSGLHISHNGKELIKEKAKNIIDSYSSGNTNQINKNLTISFITSYSYQFRPSYIISSITQHSPAANAGLLKGDVILKVNNKWAHNFDRLSEIVSLFQSGNNKKIRIVVDRDGKKMRFEFRLKKKI